MLELERIASAVPPLLIAFFNLLIAGHSLQAKGDKTLFRFGLAPLAVGLWAAAWFASTQAPALLGFLQMLAGAAGAVVLFGFTLDAMEVLPVRARRQIVIGAAISGVFLAVALASLTNLSAGRIAGAVGRGAGLVCLGALGTALLRGRKVGDPLRQKAARHGLVVIACAAVGYGAFALVALIDERAGVDPLLLLMLIGELVALVYIVDRRVEMQIVLSRAVTYAVLAMLAGGLGVLGLRGLGYDVDVRLLALSVGVALAAALLFLLLGEAMSRGVARVLFPGHARLADSLLGARGEVASLRRRLERIERLALAGELAAQVAHEIKNPLSPIRGYAELLAGKLDQVDPSERAIFVKGLRIIREESDRIDRRIADLLAFARGDRGAAPATDRGCDLHQVLLEAIAVAEGEPAIRGIVRRLDPAIGLVGGDEDEIRGAISNLLKNAAEAMTEQGGGVIEVRTQLEAERAILEVLDEGPGPSGEVDQMFEPFFTTKSGGTGLGLAIARSAIEAAGGRISIEARGDRPGAKARIELPPRPAAAKEPGAVLEPEPSQGGAGR